MKILLNEKGLRIIALAILFTEKAIPNVLVTNRKIKGITKEKNNFLIEFTTPTKPFGQTDYLHVDMKIDERVINYFRYIGWMERLTGKKKTITIDE